MIYLDPRGEKSQRHRRLFLILGVPSAQEGAPSQQLSDMSYGQYFWRATWARILFKEFSTGHTGTPIYRTLCPWSTSPLLSIASMVAHVETISVPGQVGIAPGQHGGMPLLCRCSTTDNSFGPQSSRQTNDGYFGTYILKKKTKMGLFGNERLGTAVAKIQILSRNHKRFS